MLYVSQKIVFYSKVDYLTVIQALFVLFQRFKRKSVSLGCDSLDLPYIGDHGEFALRFGGILLNKLLVFLHSIFNFRKLCHKPVILNIKL